MMWPFHSAGLGLHPLTQKDVVAVLGAKGKGPPIDIADCPEDKHEASLEAPSGPACLVPPFTQGWSSAYSIESVIMQISATLVKGKARVQFGANKVRILALGPVGLGGAKYTWGH